MRPWAVVLVCSLFGSFRACRPRSPALSDDGVAAQLEVLGAHKFRIVSYKSGPSGCYGIITRVFLSAVKKTPSLI